MMRRSKSSESSPCRIEMVISTSCPRWPDIAETAKGVKDALLRTDAFASFADNLLEISVVLADDAFIQNLNKTYRGKDKPTNVLSFPQAPDPAAAEIHLGDVVLAYETVLRESEKFGRSFDDHLAHLLIHGILHLLGYDHEDDEQADIMESLEIRLLNDMGIKNPYIDIVE